MNSETAPVEKPSKKVLPAREPTNTRLSEAQKARIAKDNRTIWIGLARGQSKNRTALFTQLDLWVRTQLKGLRDLEEVTKIATSYIIATFSNTNLRDIGIGKIKAATFRWNEDIIPVQCCPFGQTESESDKIWHIPAPGLSHNDIISAIISIFNREKTFLPNFEGRKQMKIGVVDGTWVLKFDEVPHFFKRIPSILDASTLFVTTDPRGACRLCNAAGHTSWNCANPETKTTLSTEERHTFRYNPEPIEVDDSGSPDAEICNSSGEEEH